MKSVRQTQKVSTKKVEGMKQIREAYMAAKASGTLGKKKAFKL